VNDASQEWTAIGQERLPDFDQICKHLSLQCDPGTDTSVDEKIIVHLNHQLQMHQEVKMVVGQSSFDLTMRCGELGCGCRRRYRITVTCQRGYCTSAQPSVRMQWSVHGKYALDGMRS